MEILAITLVAIGDDVSCNDADIRQRIATSKRGKRTTQYIAYRDGSEIGFVALDDIAELGCLVLYELFVPSRLRGSGLGAQLLDKVEAIARTEGYERVTLYPRPLEPGFPEERLIAWYRRHGYTTRSDSPTDLEKTI
ncbi:GNAT family N-acetyltransferase [Bradyrhizobium sp. Cp5.3]|uniref:GNAT family N-acetyltransferase n=1 Tax=Bradyrhizobium sp. Cp5.3 TaxID=443598 RepID=UPI000684C399|nr:GNAT family N-acetyltransferase [Bradyrhizobium sp. Cp5.3]